MKILMHYFLLFSLVIWNSTSSTANEKFYTIAVVPQFSSTQIHRDWTPLLSRLEQATGYRFQLIVYDKFSQFEKEMKNGIPDLIFINPYHMVLAKQAQGYRPLLRDDSPLSGILVLKKDSPIKSLSELNGKAIAFPSPNALGASLYMRALLVEKMHIKVIPVYVGSHQNVYRHVLLGEAAAGGGIKSTLEKEAEGIRSQLTILYTTPELASHPLAVHPRVPRSSAKKITESILAMRTDPEAGKLLAAIQMPQPVTANYERDYAILAKLKLERYAESQAQ